MTLKQFGYLAAGSTFAYLLFVFLAHDYPYAAWPLIITAVCLGAGFAFVPIGSRPLDHWLAAFLKAIYSPTKRAWRKNGKTFKEDPLFQSRLVMYLSGPSAAPASGEAALRTETPIPRQSDAPALRVIPASSEPLPSKEELGKTVDLARKAQQLQMKIIQTERNLSQIKAAAEKPVPVPVDYSQQVNAILSDLQNLVNQASAIKQQIQAVQAPPAPTPLPAVQPVSREKVKVIIPSKPIQTQVALTTFPNIINGIIKDNQNNYLEGVVAVIYDKEGLPVRALKTNKLGQFTGSTPLPNGTYTLELEKDSFTFDVLQIELNGGVMPPLRIAAK